MEDKSSIKDHWNGILSAPLFLPIWTQNDLKSKKKKKKLSPYVKWYPRAASKIDKMHLFLWKILQNWILDQFQWFWYQTICYLLKFCPFFFSKNDPKCPIFGQKTLKNPKFDIWGNFWPFFGKIIKKKHFF